MRKFITLFLVLMFVTVSLAFGADPAPPVAAVSAVAPSLFDWFLVNKSAVFGVALAISEFMAIIPAFKGNGIIDTIIKALQTLSGKEVPANQ